MRDVRSKHVRMMVYGVPGVGKTRLAGTSPGKTLILRPPTDHTDSIPSDSKAEEWEVSDWAAMNDALEYLRHEGDQWDWVWLDSVSLWQDIGLDDIWQTVIAEKPHRARYGLDKAEYGINMHRLGVWFRHVVGTDAFNFGVTAHPRELRPTEEEDDDEVLMPWIQGKNMAPKICGYMHVVAYYGINNKGARVIRTQPTDEFYAKDQFDAFEDGKMVNPTMGKIVSAIKKARGSTTGKTKRRRPRRKTTGRS